MKFVLPFFISFVFLQAAHADLIEELGASTTRTGYFNLVKTPNEVLGERDADRLNPVMLATEQVEWRVYVPRNYDPQSPPGVLVFVSSIEWGGIPEEWQLVKEREVRLVHTQYVEAGLERSERITIKTRRRRLPQPKYVENAIDYFDGAELVSE